MADRISIRRSPWDLQLENEPAHLIAFVIRGSRGVVKGECHVDTRYAAKLWRDLGKLLGKSAEHIDNIEELRLRMALKATADALDHILAQTVHMPTKPNGHFAGFQALQSARQVLGAES